jgi:hypothetical protein
MAARIPCKYPIVPSKLADRDAAVAAFNLSTQQVHDAIAPERLLVFDVAEGWEPLCRFLKVPVPDTPFPHRNSRGDFWDVLGGEPSYHRGWHVA